jgi:hypothetical protein
MEFLNFFNIPISSIIQFDDDGNGKQSPVASKQIEHSDDNKDRAAKACTVKDRKQAQSIINTKYSEAPSQSISVTAKTTERVQRTTQQKRNHIGTDISRMQFFCDFVYR